jgi:predicted patatin/cPLA2 family phospholipase
MERYADVGLVLEGGGFRGIYTAAVLDAFYREKLFFDYAVAVSAGAAYGVSYVSRQYGRNLDVNPYVADKRYCSLNNLIRKGNYFDWDFIYRHIPTTIIPFDYESFSKSTTRMKVVVTNCRTGAAEYKDLEATSPERFRDLLAATSSLPFISKMQQIDSQHYLDGGITDSIPFKKAFADGKKRVIVVLTRHAGYQKEPIKGKLLLKLAYRGYPNMVNAILDRARKYNQALEELERLEAEGTIFVIRPEQPIAVARLENNPENLANAYELATKEMEKVLPKLKSWLDRECGISE